MSRFRSPRQLALFGALALLSGGSWAQTSTPDVQILVYGIHHGGQIVYRYQVRNGTASNIDQVDLGLANPGQDLPAVPWSSTPGYTETPVEVPAALCQPFACMTCAVAVYQFDYMQAARAIIVMRGTESQYSSPSPIEGAAFIAPGTTSSVAQVYVPTRAAEYLSASGSVRLFDNPPKDATGHSINVVEVPFTRVDVRPPVITGSITATKQGGMLNVRVNLQVTDDFDPMPEVRLMSVTANQPLHPGDVQAAVGTDARTLQVKRYEGRIYHLTYRATDASENSSETVMSVPGALPQAQREHVMR